MIFDVNDCNFEKLIFHKLILPLFVAIIIPPDYTVFI